jgi:NAD(P)-dependent dehydrogenase (short-subunit alcohol dehydrogenase family)
LSVIVTGAALGIGRRTTELLLAAGETVVAVDRDVSPLEELRDAIRVVEGDVTDPLTIERACDAAIDVTGLVACAGISRPGPSASYSASDWSEIIDINLGAVFLAIRGAAKRALDGASFVAISSISGMQGFAGRAAYSASKAGVDGLVRTLAVEYAPRLRVNAVAPGYIMTDLVRRNLASGAIVEDTILSRTPMGRWGTPDDVGQAVQFLLSPASSFITGITLPVDGGWTSYGLGLGG